MSDEEWSFPRGKGSLPFDPWAVPTVILSSNKAHLRAFSHHEPCQGCAKPVAIYATRHERHRKWVVCSPTCYYRAVRSRRRDRGVLSSVSIKCELCGMERIVRKEFLNRAKYCSDACKKRAWYYRNKGAEKC